MRQWLHIIILECVNGSKISSLLASMAPDFHPYQCQRLQNFRTKIQGKLYIYGYIFMKYFGLAINFEPTHIFQFRFHRVSISFLFLAQTPIKTILVAILTFAIIAIFNKMVIMATMACHDMAIHMVNISVYPNDRKNVDYL